MNGTGRRRCGLSAVIPGGEGEADKAQVHHGERKRRKRAEGGVLRFPEESNFVVKKRWSGRVQRLCSAELPGTNGAQGGGWEQGPKAAKAELCETACGGHNSSQVRGTTPGGGSSHPGSICPGERGREKWPSRSGEEGRQD